MTDPKPTLDQFVTAVAGMRAYQTAFFHAPPGSDQRQDALRSSKAAEKRVDDMIKVLRGVPEARGGLFGHG